MKYLNNFYKSLLLLNLAVMPSAALAVEPVIDGAKTANPVQINAVNNWNTLLTTVVTIPDGMFHCEVTCTSTVKNPQQPTDQDYFYAAFDNNGANNPAPADACVREFDFKEAVPAAVDEIEHQVVASTCFTPNLPAGNRSFHCLGRKAPGEVNTDVLNTSMHVICVDDRG
jgi:hypothetical protein